MSSEHDRTTLITGFGVGAALGYLYSIFATKTANAAVSVRPELADVSLIDAAMTQHGWDWAFYHYPDLTTGLSILAGAFIGLGIAAWWDE